jgi:hypothetical protein
MENQTPAVRKRRDPPRRKSFRSFWKPPRPREMDRWPRFYGVGAFIQAIWSVLKRRMGKVPWKSFGSARMDSMCGQIKLRDTMYWTALISFLYFRLEVAYTF